MSKGYLKSGFILSYAAILIQSVVSIVFTPVLLRLLGQSDYGLLQLATTQAAHLGILSFGFSGSYLRFYSKYMAVKDKSSVSVLNGTFLTVFLLSAALSLVCGGAIIAISPAVFGRSMSGAELDSLRVLLGIMTVNLALTFPSGIFDSYIVAHEKFAFQKLLLIFTSLLTPLLTVLLLSLGGTSRSAALCIAIVTLIKLIVSGVYCVKRLGMRFSFSFNWNMFKPICTFSFFVFLNMISDQINWSADKTILGIVRGSNEVTLYSLGAQINTYFLTISYALSSLFSPRAYRIASVKHSENMLNRFFARFGRIQLCVMGFVFLALIAAGKPFMRIWSGLDTDVPYYTAMLLISPLIVTSMQSVGIEIQRAKDLHRFRSVLYLAVAALNIIISIPLCLRFGALGGAAGTAFGLVVGNIIIMNIYYHKRVKLNMAYFWREAAKLLPAFILPTLCAVVLRDFVRQSLSSVIIACAILAAIYLPSVWLLGLSKDIKNKPSM